MTLCYLKQIHNRHQQKHDVVSAYQGCLWNATVSDFINESPGIVFLSTVERRYLRIERHIGGRREFGVPRTSCLKYRQHNHDKDIVRCVSKFISTAIICKQFTDLVVVDGKPVKRSVCLCFYVTQPRFH